MSSQPPETIEGRIALEYSQDVPTFYVNHAEIAAGQHECAIWFARLPARPSADEIDELRDTGAIIVEPEVQLLIPHSLISGLIGALEKVRGVMEQRNAMGAKNAGS